MAQTWQPTSIRDINEGTVANDGTGDSIRNAFLKVDENFSNITSFFNGGGEYSSGPAFSTLTVANLTSAVSNIGNLTLANVNSQTTFYANINIGANIVPTAYGQYNLGSPDRPFANLYVIQTVSTSQVQTSTDAGLLIVHANATPGDIQDVGIFGNVYHGYGANTYTFFGWQKTSSNFVYKITPTDATKGNSVVYDGVYGNVQFGSLHLSNNTPATSNVTGALIVSGGIGSGHDIWAAGNIYQRGFRTLTTSDVSTLGYPVYNGIGSLFVGNTVFSATTPSTSTNTGAVVVLGGVGVAGNINAGAYYGNFLGNITNPVQTGITTVGSLGNLTVIGTTSTGQLQATGVGATGIVATSLSVTGTGNITNLNAGKITNAGNFDVTAGNVTISPDNTAIGFVATGGLTNAVLTMNKSVNSFVQAALRNSSTGTSASSDFIAYANNGTNVRGFIDMGIANSGFNDPAFGITKAGDGYIFVSAPTGTGGNLVLATADGTRNDIVFAAGGFISGTEQGRFRTNDGLYLTGNLVATTGTIYQGEGAKTLEIDNFFYPGYAGLTNASGIFVGNTNSFVQLAMRNHDPGNAASTDLIAYSSNGDNDSGWIDLGITSETFDDPTYGVTGPADGYVFMSAPAGTTGNGSMFLSTSNNGAQNDIVFSTNGFATGNERVRIVGVGRPGRPAGVEVNIATTSTSTTSGALRVRGGVGIQGNLNVAGDVAIVGNLSFGGNGTSVSSSTLTVENPITFLANANNGNLFDIGILGQYRTTSNVFTGLIRQATTGGWRLIDSISTRPVNSITWSQATNGNLMVGSAIVANSTASTSTTTGALQVVGGMGVGGSIFVGTNIVPGANNTSNIGSVSNWFNTFFGVSTQARYADLAEKYLADEEYDPGTVVIFGGEKEITVTYEFADTRVAGAVSTNPAYLMNAAEPGIPVALRGKVPVKVYGPVSKGDCLVTSDRPGYAVSVGRSKDHGKAVFAKSLEDNQEPGVKIITAVIL